MTMTRPRRVCLCGSTRFRAEFDVANRALTLAGCIVLAPGVFAHSDGTPITEAEKTALDALHLAKIDLADEVFVVNPGGYIGASTANEIGYAIKAGKPVRYLSETPADADTSPVVDELYALAEQVGACPPPNIAAGYDLCTCGTGPAWPCPRTRLVWLAAGIDADAEIKRVCDAAAFDAWLENGPYPDEYDEPVSGDTSTRIA